VNEIVNGRSEFENLLAPAPFLKLTTISLKGNDAEYLHWCCDKPVFVAFRACY
jgi:hypothetical protein